MDADVDKETARLANEIRDILGKHISKFDENNYKQTLTSCLIALAIEVGRLRWLCTETEEVTEDTFDETFWHGAMTHFKENKARFGTGH